MGGRQQRTTQRSSQKWWKMTFWITELGGFHSNFLCLLIFEIFLLLVSFRNSLKISIPWGRSQKRSLQIICSTSPWRLNLGTASSLLDLWVFIEISWEHPELEGNHRDHQVQFLQYLIKIKLLQFTDHYGNNTGYEECSISLNKPDRFSSEFLILSWFST